MTDAQQPVWIRLWNDGTASWSDDGNVLFLPGDTGKPFMEVKPCPVCEGEGWKHNPYRESVKECVECKDGWVIA